MKPKHYSRMVDTRRLYLFERLYLRYLPVDARRSRSISELRELAGRVWAKHNRKGLAVPSIKAHRGVGHNGFLFSYAHGYKEIFLSRAQRNAAILLHEIVHTLGYGFHNRAFVRKYVDLLVEFCGCDRGELILALSMFNIKV